jgi:hypothetical protein
LGNGMRNQEQEEECAVAHLSSPFCTSRLAAGPVQDLFKPHRRRTRPRAPDPHGCRTSPRGACKQPQTRSLPGTARVSRTADVQRPHSSGIGCAKFPQRYLTGLRGF